MHIVAQIVAQLPDVADESAHCPADCECRDRIPSMVTEEQWEMIEPIFPGRAGDVGRPAEDNRRHFEGILWIAREGARWRNLPRHYGKWNTVYQRWMRWNRHGVFLMVLKIILGRGDKDTSTIMVDGTVVQCDFFASAGGRLQDAADTARKKIRDAIGRSVGGWTTKILVACDAKGDFVGFSLHPGNRGEAPLFFDLIEPLVDNDALPKVEEIIADRAYDSDKIRRWCMEKGIKEVIPPKANRKDPPDFDAERYAMRNCVERLTGRLKLFHGVQTRYAKLPQHYAAVVTLAAWYYDTR